MGRKPNFRVAALDKVSDIKAQVGAAWSNDDGSISVVLNNFVVLPPPERLVLTLFPSDQPTEMFKKRKGKESGDKPF